MSVDRNSDDREYAWHRPNRHVSLFTVHWSYLSYKSFECFEVGKDCTCD